VLAASEPNAPARRRTADDGRGRLQHLLDAPASASSPRWMPREDHQPPSLGGGADDQRAEIRQVRTVATKACRDTPEQYAQSIRVELEIFRELIRGAASSPSSAARAARGRLDSAAPARSLSVITDRDRAAAAARPRCRPGAGRRAVASIDGAQ
jgi:hypothetical protein